MSVSKLSEVLMQSSVDVAVLTTTANGKVELDLVPARAMNVDGVPVTYYKRLTRDHTHFSPQLYIGLIEKINTAKAKNNPLIIHIHAWWNLVSIFSCLIAILKKVPVILSPRGTLSTYSFGNKNDFIKKSIHFLLGKRLLKRCHIHATSENERAAIMKLFKPKGISVIPNLVTLPLKYIKLPGHAILNTDPSKPLPQKKKTFELLFFSRIEHKKGLELLFHALQKLDFTFHLTVAGGGDQEYVTQLKNLTNLLKIGNKISWIGQQAPEKKFEIMAKYDALILPSYDENFANVVIESLACGTPVIITGNVGLSDYVLKKDFGWVCQFNELDLILKLKEANKDLVKRERIRSEAPDTIRNDFSDEKISKRYIEMYNLCISY
jgi:glycosyltransferase involved in cell wall biosynthesis